MDVHVRPTRQQEIELCTVECGGPEEDAASTIGIESHLKALKVRGCFTGRAAMEMYTGIIRLRRQVAEWTAESTETAMHGEAIPHEDTSRFAHRAGLDGRRCDEPALEIRDKGESLCTLRRMARR